MPVVKLIIDGLEYNATPVPPPISKFGLQLVPVSADPTAIASPLDALPNWQGEHDQDTSGKSSGTTTYPVLMGGRQARLFTNDYTNNGGMRYHVTYGNDTVAKNFVYAGDLYFTSVAGLAQMELDNNQVTSDGKTYIFGCQCNDNSKTWDITQTDQGKKSSGWVHTAVNGTPQSFPLNRWVHFEIASHRDDSGNITYDAIHFDGVTSLIGTKLPASLPLGWTPFGTMLVNVQLGGSGASGSLKVYGNNLQVVRW